MCESRCKGTGTEELDIVAWPVVGKLLILLFRHGRDMGMGAVVGMYARSMLARRPEMLFRRIRGCWEVWKSAMGR